MKDKRFLLLLVGFSIILLAVSGIIYWQKNAYDPSKYDEYVSTADSAYEEAQYSIALDGYLKALDVAPRELDAYVGAISVLVDKSRFEDAENIISQIDTNLEAENEAKLWVILGEGYARERMYAKAYEAFYEANKLHGTSSQAESAAMTSMQSGNYSEIDTILEQVDSDSESKTIWEEYNSLGDEDADLYEVVTASQEFLNMDIHPLAIDLLEDRMEDMVEYWEGKYFLGRAYYDAGDIDKALIQFESAVALGADDPDLYWHLARINMDKSRNSAAFDFYDRAIQFSDDDDVQPLVDEYVNVLIENEQYSKTEDLLERFSKQNYSHIGFMKLYYAEGKLNDMVEISKEYEVGDEENPVNLADYYSVLISHYLNEGELNSALVLVEDLGELEGEAALFEYYSGLYSKYEEDLVEAKIHFERSLDLDLRGDVSELAKKELSNL